MPFYVSPEQIMRDKSEYARTRIAREARTAVALQYAGGILMVAPNRSTALHKISELYDRIAFAAGGRYNEYEALRKAGVTYADLTGYQFDRRDVTARALANWYAQTLGGIFIESSKPYEVEIVVAEVGLTPDSDQIYRITFDGVLSDEPGFVAFGGQADVVTAALKESFRDGMSLTEALGAALEALAAPAKQGSSGNGPQQADLTASQLEVAVLDRARAHRTFRRLRGPRLEELLAESRAAAPGTDSGTGDSGDSGSGASGSGSGSGASDTGGSGSGASGSAGGGSGSGASDTGGSGSGATDTGTSAPGDSSGSGGTSGSGGPSGSSSTSGSGGTSGPPDEPPTGPTSAGGDGIPRPPAGK